MWVSNFYENSLVFFSYILIILLIFVIFLISLNFKHLNNKFISVFSLLFLLIFSIIAFYTKPYESDDLFRYFGIMVYFENFSINRIFDFGFNSTIISNLILFLISKTGIFSLLPLITLQIEILLLYLILVYTHKSIKITFFSYFIYLFSIFAILSLYVSISGFRFNLSIFLSSFFLLLYNTKRINWFTFMFLLIIPGLIHQYSLVFIIAGLILKIKFLKDRLYLPVLITFILIIFFLSLDLSSFNYLNSLQIKLNVYYQSNLISSSFFRNTGYIIVVVFFLIISTNLRGTSIVSQYGYFIRFIVYIAISSYLFFPEIFYRSISIIALNSLPLLIYKTRMFNINFKQTYSLNILFYLLGLFILSVYEFINYYRDWMFYL